ncbi:MAG: hypothetical protein ABI680_04160 [Chthoniobacteraceae bacterium]
MNKNEAPDATPDQLLQLLDQQIRRARDERRIAPRSRSALLLGGILLILAGTTAALLFLQNLLLQSGSLDRIGRKSPTLEMTK